MGCLVMLMFVLAGVVFIRFVPVARLSWSDEIVEWSFAWMVFLGAAALWRENEHFCVDALELRLGNRPSGRAVRLLVELLSILFFCVFTYYSFQLTVQANDRSPILEWPRPLWYASMPLAGVIMVGYSVRNICKVALDILSNRRPGEG